MSSLSTLATSALVHNLLISFRGKRAVGIEYVPNPVFQPNATPDVKVVRAKRLVVVSAGTFGSPGILERSGIGAKSVLEKAGVEQIVDLPGVGENYQGTLVPILLSVCLCVLRKYHADHPTIFAPYLASADSFTLDGIGRGDPKEVDSQLPLCSLCQISMDSPQSGTHNGSRMARA